jgi:hypothetical protein
VRGNGDSYKEPPQLKFSQLEGKKDKGKEVDELSSGVEGDEDEAEQTSRKKEKGQKKRRVSASGKAAPTKKANNPLRHSFDGSEGLLGVSVFARAVPSRVIVGFLRSNELERNVSVPIYTRCTAGIK